MPHPSGLGLLVMLRCFQEKCKGCVQLPECTGAEAMWRRIWLPECTRAEAMWRRIRLPECTRADAMWRRIIGSSASWELVAGRVQLRSRCGFSDVPGVVARSWVSLLGPQLVLLISALQRWLLSSCQWFDMSFINILSGPGQKRVSAYLSSTRQSYLVGLWWENQVELEIQPFKWLFWDVNGEWRPLKIKKNSTKSHLVEEPGWGEVLIQRSPPEGWHQGKKCGRGKEATLMCQKSPLITLISSRRALLGFCLR